MESNNSNPTVNPSENQIQPQLVSHSVNNQRGFFPIILGVLILLLVVAGGAYYLGTQNSNKQTVSSQTSNPSPTASSPTETPSPTPTFSVVNGTKTNKGMVTVDVTTNEKVYTSSVVNFSIRVPKDWRIDDKQGVFISSPGEVVFAPAGSDTYSPFSLKLAVTTSKNGNTRLKYGTENEFQQQLAAPISPGTGQRLYKIGNVKIDGKDAIQFVNRALPGDPTEAYYAVITWVRNNGLNYYFEFEPDEKGVQANLSTYNKIISTVKFAN